jgi:hypothetical protein
MELWCATVSFQIVRGNKLSKERPGWLVTETLKTEYWYKYDTSKKSNFYADFKYISIINSVLPIKSYEAKKFALFLKKRETSHKSHIILPKITQLDVACQITLL